MIPDGLCDQRQKSFPGHHRQLLPIEYLSVFTCFILPLNLKHFLIFFATRKSTPTTIMTQVQQGTLLEVLKKKMRALKDELEQALEQADEYKMRMLEETRRREEVRHRIRHSNHLFFLSFFFLLNFFPRIHVFMFPSLSLSLFLSPIPLTIYNTSSSIHSFMLLVLSIFFS